MDYKNINDYELLYLIEEEGDVAYDILYQKYLPLIKNITIKFYKYLKGYGVEFDDLFQEAYLAFLKTIKLFNDKENTLFYTFLRININSKLLNYSRVITSQKNLFYLNMISLNEPLSYNNDITVGDCVKDNIQEDPLMSLEYYETFKRIETFKLELIPLHSQIFELVCNGFNNREIANLLDLSVKDVSNVLYRIRKRLKLYLSSSQ